MKKFTIAEAEELWNRSQVAELRKLIGQKVEQIVVNEYSVEVRVEGGVTLKVAGHTYDDCSLDVEVEDPAAPKQEPLTAARQGLSVGTWTFEQRDRR